MSKSFDELVSKATSCGTKKLAVAVAQDDAVLEAVKIAKERGNRRFYSCWRQGKD